MISNTSKADAETHSEGELIGEVLSGNTAMFEILIRRYNPFLYKIGRGYGFSHHDTEDLMQETFVSSYVNLKQFSGKSSFKTWLIKIMLNFCYHKTKKKSFKNEKPADQFLENDRFMFGQSNRSENSNIIINRELSNVVESCLQKLAPDYRTTFTLRELAGLSIVETAELMHTSVSNVKVRLNRAKALLRKEIEKIYTTDDIYEFNLVYCDRVVNAVMQKIITK